MTERTFWILIALGVALTATIGVSLVIPDNDSIAEREELFDFVHGVDLDRWDVAYKQGLLSTRVEAALHIREHMQNREAYLIESVAFLNGALVGHCIVPDAIGSLGDTVLEDRR